MDKSKKKPYIPDLYPQTPRMLELKRQSDESLRRILNKHCPKR